MRALLRGTGIALLTLLAGCAWINSLRGGGAGDDPLRVGTTGTYPPFSFDRGGTLEGIEIDFARALGAELGRGVEIFRVPLPDLIGELNADRIDVVMTGMSVTASRAALVDFAEPYLELGQMALVRAQDGDRFVGRDWVKIDGLRVGFERSTTGAKFVRNELPQMTPVEFSNKSDAIAALKEGKIDVLVHDAPFVWLISGSPQAPNEELLGRYNLLTNEKLAWAVRKDDDDLQVRLNGIVARWKASGKIDEILDRWIRVRKIARPIPPH